jgi:DNA-binding FadR family transcriptional regulator
MPHAIQPLSRQSLADDLAQRIKQLIQRRGYQSGSRLPSIAEMARDFRVGAPTVREALKTLAAVGVVDIRHGSGVYVSRSDDSLVITNPVFEGAASKKLLVDLVEARIPIETTSARLAATNATEEHLGEMRRLLAHAGESLDDANVLNQTNLAFHRHIAVASGNEVIRQLLDVLTSVFRGEQRVILDIQNTRESDHREHVEILRSLEARDPALATRLMHDHLDNVRRRLLEWDPSAQPVA